MSGEPIAKVRAALIESLRAILEYAVARRGPRITLETFARDRAPAQFLGPTTDALAVREVVGDEVGFTIDLSHLVQLGEHVSSSVSALAPWSQHVHLSTCVLAAGHPLDGDQHPTFDEAGVALSITDGARAIRGRRGSEASSPSKCAGITASVPTLCPTVS